MLGFLFRTINGRPGPRRGAVRLRSTAEARRAALVCRRRGAGHDRRALRGAGDDRRAGHGPARTRRRGRHAARRSALTERFIEVMETRASRARPRRSRRSARPCASWSASLAPPDRAVARGGCGETDWARGRARQPLQGASRRPMRWRTAAAGAAAICGLRLDAIGRRRPRRREDRMTDRFAHRLQARPDPRRRAARPRRRRGRAQRGRRAARPCRRSTGSRRMPRSAATGEMVRADGPARRVARARAAWSPASRSPAHVDEPFELVFMPEPPAGRAGRGDRARRERLRRRLPRRRRRSTSARRSPTRWRSASTPIRAAPAPRRRSRRRAC